MKKTTLALALLAPFATQAETINLQIEKPQFYGRVSLSVQSAYENNDSSTQMNSNNSRLGLKGSGALAHGLKAIYQLEYAIYPDAKGKGDTEGKELTARDTFIGIQGGFGEVKAGHFNTPFKNIEKKVDVFNDLEGDLKHFVSEDQDRKSNSVQYASPSVAGLKLAMMLTANNDEQSTTGDDGVSASLAYERGNWYLAYALNDGIDGTDTDSQRVVLQTKVGAVQLGALWEERDEGNGANDAWLASAAWKATSDLTLKAQGGQSDIVAKGGETYSLGLDYALASNAKTFVYATSNRADDRSKDADYVGVGLEYNF